MRQPPQITQGVSVRRLEGRPAQERLQGQRNEPEWGHVGQDRKWGALERPGREGVENHCRDATT